MTTITTVVAQRERYGATSVEKKAVTGLAIAMITRNENGMTIPMIENNQNQLVASTDRPKYTNSNDYKDSGHCGPKSSDSSPQFLDHC
jgi:hypothetical protein